jgi:SpoVK/Ycf46/Vps4 family AAA+-type ATPase
MTYEALYKISEGGAVVVRYLASDDSEDDSNASSERDVIENICEMAKRYRNKVLTVLCFPRECKKVKAQFYENLGTMAFIELREDFIDSASAKEFLTSRAKENHVRTDKKLFADIKDDHSYLITELQGVFDEWYNQKLKTTVYPQYKDVAVARKETVKAKPQGSAYDELMEMIGLADAKQVIKKALNYYKMQKLYEEKGVKRDAPAMHMVFSGNPGTAKTTVARLFARIMRENRLLSKGQLIEVGRGDLVGKYVGWTAPLIKDKFKAAAGGVLFIDEAYSLVDDRDGSYGDEAINTIVQEMENHRADVVVIFAGYPDKMEGFLAKNPGLRSRIAFHVPFADYDSEELCEIADMISKKNGMRIDHDARIKLEKAFDLALTNTDFGNGRYVRNMFEQAKMNQASRLLEKDFDSITADEITTITADDIVLPEPKKCEKRRIGFY